MNGVDEVDTGRYSTALAGRCSNAEERVDAELPSWWWQPKLPPA
jgi:hypothetical protein